MLTLTKTMLLVNIHGSSHIYSYQFKYMLKQKWQMYILNCIFLEMNCGIQFSKRAALLCHMQVIYKQYGKNIYQGRHFFNDPKFKAFSRLIQIKIVFFQGLHHHFEELGSKWNGIFFVKIILNHSFFFLKSMFCFQNVRFVRPFTDLEE